MGKTKAHLFSESCILKNVLKYASYDSWMLDKNKQLVENLSNTIVVNTLLPKGWMASCFGDDLLSDEVATHEILLLLAALLAYECKDNPSLEESLLFSRDHTFFLDCFVSSRSTTLTSYPTPALGKNDIELTDATIFDITKGFQNPESLVVLIRDHPKDGDLRQKWFKNSKKQLKPLEIKLLWLVACLLLGAPDCLNAGKSVSKLLTQAFNVARTPIKKAQRYLLLEDK